MIDLHVHTTASDGTLTPQEVVAYAKKENIEAIAITDHDTVAGIGAAILASETLGVKVIPGVEISVDHAGQEMHILGYFLHVNSPDLQQSLNELQRYREERNPKIVKKLQELGMKITLSEVMAEAGGQIVGRPHFAALLVKKGFVRDKQEAFDKYLASGRPGYVKKEKLLPQEGIQLILSAGGIPVLAHPKYLKEQGYAQLENLLVKLKGFGLMGIEAYYPHHDALDTAAYLKMAQKHSLLVTGGTDFHGGNKPEIELGIGTGELNVPFALVRNMENVWNQVGG